MPQLDYIFTISYFTFQAAFIIENALFILETVLLVVEDTLKVRITVIIIHSLFLIVIGPQPPDNS